MSMAEKIDAAIKDIEKNFSGGLSNTSTKKFDALMAIVSTITGLPEDEIYPTSVVARASNVWNRLSQGKPLNKHFSLAIAIGAKGAEGGMMAPLASFIGDGNVHYDTIAILSPDSAGVWRFSHVVTNAKDECALKIKEVYPDVKLHLLNAYKSAKKNVVRACLFSDLENKFEEWLPKNGVVSAAGKYVRNLKAISEPQQPHNGTGKWDGLFHDLIGEDPECKIFEVTGLDNFKAVYGEIIPFFNGEFEDKENLASLYGSASYSRIFDFVHAAPSKTEIAEKDSQFTRSGFRKYHQFLGDLEAIVNACSEAGGQLAYQLITYGAPGTGKSFRIKGETAKAKVFRTTFHPDSDYASFVGAYKPIMKSVERTALVGKKLEMADVESVKEELKKEKVISYEFVDQVFTQAYIQAWAYQKVAKDGETPKRVYLVIEEINRGNCAQVFGDLFQLLDRNASGFSDYAIKPDSDFGRHIGEALGKAEGTFDEGRKSSINALYPDAEEGVNVVDEVMAGRLMLLSDNLLIRATMNTSDQSLFPMDSAFKRRWDWDYVAIQDHPEEEWEIEIDAATHYRWWDFLEAINKEIFKATSSEDKQLGYFFVRAKDKKIDLNMFVNKVVFYLWNSVFKDCYTDCEFMKQEKDSYFTFTSFFKGGKPDAGQAKAFLGKLKLDVKAPPTSNAEVPETPSDESGEIGGNQGRTEANT